MTFLKDLNIEKYGLGHLAEKRPVDFAPDEIEQALDAFDKEDMAPPVFDATVNPARINELLSRSHCRKCGKCCQPNPRNPSYPGVEIIDDELRRITRHYRISHRAVKKGTKKGGRIKNPDPPYETLNTRWLIQPCMFYDSKKRQCGVHELRPTVCKIYPLVFYHSLISLKVSCEYGKDLYRSLMEEMRNKKL